MLSFKQTFERLNKSPMIKELKAIVKGSAVLSVIAFLISIVWGFQISMLIGLLIGWAYLSLCYCYLALTVCSIASMKDSKKAKQSMWLCYIVRFFGLFVLCWAGFELEFFSPVGILIPQFFPRFILTYTHFSRKGDKNGRS